MGHITCNQCNRNTLSPVWHEGIAFCRPLCRTDYRNALAKKYEPLLELIRKRSYMFCCGFNTTWEQHLTSAEKQGFSYEKTYAYWLGN